jgi:uncharacterized protein (DUF302 family)
MISSPRRLAQCAWLALGLALGACATTPAGQVQPATFDSGVVQVPSAYGMAETIARVKQDIAAKGIMFFDAYDQQKLAADAGIELPPSTLLVFGNPPLGVQFLTANPLAGLDWPVRLLIFEDGSGQVWAAYTDFAHIARRHGITDRDAAFKMASEVIGAITGTIAASSRS